MVEASKAGRQASHRYKSGVAVRCQHGVLQREELHLNDLIDDALNLVQIKWVVTPVPAEQAKPTCCSSPVAFSACTLTWMVRVLDNCSSSTS